MLRHPTPHVSPACCLLPPRAVTQCWQSVHTGRCVPAGQHSWAPGDVPLKKHRLQGPSSVANVVCTAKEDLAGLHHTTAGKSQDGVRFSPHVAVFLQQAWIPYAVITVTLEKHSKRASTPQAVCKHAAVSSSFGILKTVILGGTRVAQGGRASRLLPH